MAEHYGTAVIPARPETPKDKPNAEGTVGGVISTWIIAALRSRKFFSFEELNIAIKEKLNEFMKNHSRKRTEAGFQHLKMRRDPIFCHCRLPRMRLLFGQLQPYNQIIA